MMEKFTITDRKGTPKRIIFMPAHEIKNQLARGEKARPFQDGDMPAPVTDIEESDQ